MVTQFTVTGMVLSSAPVGEYDRRIVLLTKERGKLAAFVKGSRKQHSLLSAGCRQFSFGKFTMYGGRNSYNVTGMEISEYFEDIQLDIDAVYYGFYFAELASYYTMENVPSSEMLALLYVSVNALRKDAIPKKLVRHIYELKVFAINGEYPDVFSCADCGSSDSLSSFAVGKNGVLCDKCKVKQECIDLQTSTLYTMQYVISADIKKLYNFSVTDEVLTELSMVMGRWMAKCVDKTFKSLELID